MAFDLGSLLQQYVGGAMPPANQVQDHFDQVAQNADGGLLSQGLAAAFRSDATPPFAQMAGQLFGQSNPNQQAGMLNTMIAGMGPAVLGALLSKAGGAGGALGGLGGLLGSLTGGAGAAPQLTSAQASTLTPDQVQVIASHAEQSNPGIIDQVSGFYAEHPTLVKTLGGAALSIALAKIAGAQRG
jgi:hypothetical protein